MRFQNDSDVVDQLHALARLVNVPHTSRRDVAVTEALCTRIEDAIAYMDAKRRSDVANDLRRFLTMIHSTMSHFMTRTPATDPFPTEYTFSEDRFNNYWGDVLRALSSLQSTGA